MDELRDLYRTPIPMVAREIVPRFKPRSEVLAADVSANGKHAVAAHANGGLTFWDFATGKEVIQQELGTDVSRCALAADALRFAAVYGKPPRLRVFDYLKGTRVALETKGVDQIALARNGRHLAATALEGWLWVHDLVDPSKTCRTSVQGSEPALARGGGLVISRDGRRVARAYLDGRVFVFDVHHQICSVRSARDGRAHEELRSSVCAALSADGRRAVSAGGHGAVIAWDLDKNDWEKVIVARPEDAVRDVAMTADGRHVALLGERYNQHGGQRISLQIREWSTGRLVAEAHHYAQGHLERCAMTPDGRRLVVWGDGLVFVGPWAPPGGGPPRRPAHVPVDPPRPRLPEPTAAAALALEEED
ncbi:WD40 repeat domain-containing protein [Polyangium aurulentum]|uniref:WD40 repeat domain-containing protein n=1 Tax=Polyangium aurulentum TaxID=2567896 RepID=UPI0010ADCF92|nr:hypothetical protein [Polyangium aurulentum]UQA56744.1 hypothetical protein E8A73_036400 [Polyangium aurulentum]